MISSPFQCHIKAWNVYLFLYILKINQVSYKTICRWMMQKIALFIIFSSSSFSFSSPFLSSSSYFFYVIISKIFSLFHRNLSITINMRMFLIYFNHHNTIDFPLCFSFCFFSLLFFLSTFFLSASQSSTFWIKKEEEKNITRYILSNHD